MPGFADIVLSIAMVIGPVVGYIDQVSKNNKGNKQVISKVI